MSGSSIATAVASKKVLVAVVASVVVVGGAGGAFVALQQGQDNMAEEEHHSQSLDAVPANVTLVLYYDNSVITDETTTEAVGEALDINNTTEERQKLFEEYENSTGIPATAVNHVTIFGNANSTATAAGGAESEPDETPQDSVGVIVDTSLSNEEALEVIRQQNNTTVSESTEVQGHTTYEIETERTYFEGETETTVTHAAVLGDGRFVLADNRSLVVRSVEAHEGGPTLDGKLREYLTHEEDTYVSFAVEVPEDNPQVNQSTINTPTPDFVSGHYFTTEEEVRLEFNAQMKTNQSADNVEKQINGGLATVRQQSGDEFLVNQTNEDDVTQDGKNIMVEYGATPEEVGELATIAEQALLGFSGGGGQYEEEERSDATGEINYEFNEADNTAVVTATEINGAETVYVEAVDGSSEEIEPTVEGSGELTTENSVTVSGVESGDYILVETEESDSVGQYRIP